MIDNSGAILIVARLPGKAGFALPSGRQMTRTKITPQQLGLKREHEQTIDFEVQD
jgi:hypothetical protein